MATASSDTSVKIWDARTGAAARTLSGHTAAVWNAKFSPDGSRLASAADDNTARIWDPETGAHLLSVPADTAMYGAVWGPDGTRLALLPLNRTVVILDSVPVAERPASR